MKRILQCCRYLMYCTILCLSAHHAYADAPLPEVTLIDFKTGESISTTELKGKVVYLDFWASWCKPCKKSFPFMNELQQKYSADTFKVVAINMDEFADDAKQFLADIPADFDVYTDPENKLAESLQLPGLPVAFVIDKNGIIKGRHIGFNERKKNKKIKQIEHLIGTP